MRPTSITPTVGLHFRCVVRLRDRRDAEIDEVGRLVAEQVARKRRRRIARVGKDLVGGDRAQQRPREEARAQCVVAHDPGPTALDGGFIGSVSGFHRRFRRIPGNPSLGGKREGQETGDRNEDPHDRIPSNR